MIAPYLIGRGNREFKSRFDAYQPRDPAKCWPHTLSGHAQRERVKTSVSTELYPLNEALNLGLVNIEHEILFAFDCSRDVHRRKQVN